MMNRSVYLSLPLLFLLPGALVEDVIAAQLVSPEVHADRRVTFRLRAAQAKQVSVQGIAGIDPQPMSKVSDDVWEVTIGPLAPELYSYSFLVDGTTVIDPHNRHVKKWLSVDSLLEIPGHPPLLHERQRVAHGVVHHHWYRSKVTADDRGVFVYTPPGYGDAPQARYPLVVLLHGYGDDESAWLDVGRTNCIADNLLAASQMVPSIIAMPYGHPLPIELKTPFDDYASRNLELLEPDLLENLLPYLEHAYRLRTGSDQRAIVGLSMGGGQSLTIGLRHPEVFGWVGGFSSAAPQGELGQRFPKLLTGAAATQQEPRLLWIGCGKEDFLIDRNRQFVRWLADHRIAHTFRETEGGHNWNVWRKYLAEFLPQLFRAG